MRKCVVLCVGKKIFRLRLWLGPFQITIHYGNNNTDIARQKRVANCGAGQTKGLAQYRWRVGSEWDGDQGWNLSKSNHQVLNDVCV